MQETTAKRSRTKLWWAIVLAGGFVALGGYHWLNRARYQANEALLRDLQSAKLTVPEDRPLGRDGDWPQWRGRWRDGVSREVGLLTEWSAAGPSLLWQTNVGRGYSSIAIAEGRAFTQFQDGPDEVVLCLDATTGQEKWRFAHPSPSTGDPTFGPCPRATPTVDGDRVYTRSGNGLLQCFDTASGQPRWKHDLAAEFGASLPKWGFAGSPLVEGELVIVQPGGQGGRSILAFARSDGKLVWQAQDDPAGYSSPVAATIAGKRQLIVFTGNAVVGLAPATGELYWRYAWPTAHDVNASTPIVRGDYVLVSSGYGKGCGLLHVTAGGVEAVYEHNELCNHFSSSVLVGEHVYGFSDFTLVCMEFRTGKIAWTKRGMGRGSLLAADGMLIILGESGQVVLADAAPASFRERASFRFSRQKPCWAAPALAQGALYLRDDSRLACFAVKKP
jgi:outer membrane protein assembly factor BamB